MTASLTFRQWANKSSPSIPFVPASITSANLTHAVTGSHVWKHTTHTYIHTYITYNFLKYVKFAYIHEKYMYANTQTEISSWVSILPSIHTSIHPYLSLQASRYPTTSASSSSLSMPEENCSQNTTQPSSPLQYNVSYCHNRTSLPPEASRGTYALSPSQPVMH